MPFQPYLACGAIGIRSMDSMQRRAYISNGVWTNNIDSMHRAAWRAEVVISYLNTYPNSSMEEHCILTNRNWSISSGCHKKKHGIMVWVIWVISWLTTTPLHWPWMFSKLDFNRRFWWIGICQTTNCWFIRFLGIKQVEHVPHRSIFRPIFIVDGVISWVIVG